MQRTRWSSACSLLTSSLFALSVLAPLASQAANADGPIARLSLSDGGVSIAQAEQTHKLAGEINMPLLPGDELSTSAASHAELQLSEYTMLRVAAQSTVQFASTVDGRPVFTLRCGAVDLVVLKGRYEPSPEIQTSQVGVRAHGPGVYRIELTADGRTMVTVREGEGEIRSAAGTLAAPAGTTLAISGPALSPHIASVTLSAPDEFDAFNDSRDDVLQAQLDRAVNANTYGQNAELLASGRWVNSPEQGPSWIPYEPVGWAPFQNGHWAWEDSYGWTWVGGETWGWAPYHTGRWYRGTYGWAWTPPAATLATGSHWQPAVVGFVALPGNLVAWVPLAPGEDAPATSFSNARTSDTVFAVPESSFRTGVFSAATQIDTGTLAQTSFVTVQAPAFVRSSLEPVFNHHVDFARFAPQPHHATNVAVHAPKTAHTGVGPQHADAPLQHQAASSTHSIDVLDANEHVETIDGAQMITVIDPHAARQHAAHDEKTPRIDYGDGEFEAQTRPAAGHQTPPQRHIASDQHHDRQHTNSAVEHLQLAHLPQQHKQLSVSPARRMSIRTNVPHHATASQITTRYGESVNPVNHKIEDHSW